MPAEHELAAGAVEMEADNTETEASGRGLHEAYRFACLVEVGESEMGYDQEIREWLLRPVSELDKWIERKTGEEGREPRKQ